MGTRRRALDALNAAWVRGFLALLVAGIAFGATSALDPSTADEADLAAFRPAPQGGPVADGWAAAVEISLRVQQLLSGLPQTLVPALPAASAPHDSSPIDQWALSSTDLPPGARVTFEGHVQRPGALAAYSRSFVGDLPARQDLRLTRSAVTSCSSVARRRLAPRARRSGNSSSARPDYSSR